MIVDLTQCKVLLVGTGINALLTLLLLLVLNQAGVQPSFGVMEIVSFLVFLLSAAGIIFLNIRPDLFTQSESRLHAVEDEPSCESIQMQDSE